MLRNLPFWAVALGCLLRCIQFYFKLFVGYDSSDLSIINPDELGYLHRAANLEEVRTVGRHWIYEWINSTALNMFGEARTTFIALCLLNSILFLLCGPMMITIANQLEYSCRESTKVSKSIWCFILLWPTGIWVSVANLKDSIVAFLILIGVWGYNSFNSALSGGKGVSTLKRSLIGILSFVTSVTILYPLRSYAAGILVCGVVFNELLSGSLTRRAGSMVVLSIALAPLWVFGSIGRDLSDLAAIASDVESFVHTTNLRQLSSGEELVVINTTSQNIFVGALYHALVPLPNIAQGERVYMFLAIATAVVMVLWLDIASSLKKAFAHERSRYTAIIIALFYGFYAISRGNAGPRQRFGTTDMLLAIIVIHGVASGGKPTPTRKLAYAVGSLFVIISIAYTARV